MWLTQRGVLGAGLRGHVVAQVEEGDERAVLQAEEEVRVGAVLAGAGHMIALDDVVQRQAQDVFVEVPRLLGVARAVGVMVQLLDRAAARASRPGGGWWSWVLLAIHYCVTRLLYRNDLWSPARRGYLLYHQLQLISISIVINAISALKVPIRPGPPSD